MGKKNSIAFPKTIESICANIKVAYKQPVKKKRNQTAVSYASIPKKEQKNPITMHFQSKETLMSIISFAVQSKSSYVAKKYETSTNVKSILKTTSYLPNKKISLAQEMKVTSSLSIYTGTLQDENSITKDERRKAYFSKRSELVASFKRAEKE